MVKKYKMPLVTLQNRTVGVSECIGDCQSQQGR